MTEETGARIAVALERLVLMITALLPDDQQPETGGPITVHTQEGSFEI